MISFIIIGRNEGWKLERCFQSVFKTIEENNLDQQDIIYVDSKSTDNSIEVAKSFSEVSIFEITGECNAAIARNIGAKEAKCDILFFIDGDMEIAPTFISKAINKKGELKYDYVTGHLDDYLYTIDDEFLGIRERTYTGSIPDREEFLTTNGGVFLVKKMIWDKLGGMKTKYRRSQDLDFSFRLKRANVDIIRLPYLIVKHHTVDYKNENRMWSNLSEGYIFFSSMLFRDHILDKNSWKRLFRNYYTSLALAVLIVSMLFLQHISLQLTVMYSVILFLRVTINSINSQTKMNKILFFANRILYQLLADIMFWLGVFFFFPSSKDISYKRLDK